MNKNPEVDKFFHHLDHPLKTEILKVREIILGTHPEITEAIKWKSPTFMYKGNIASFFMNAKNHVSLMFHKGALLKNAAGLLTGDGKEARTAKFANLKEIISQKEKLESVVKEWIEFKRK